MFLNYDEVNDLLNALKIAEDAYNRNLAANKLDRTRHLLKLFKKKAAFMQKKNKRYLQVTATVDY